jgi:hypothetical protein
MRSYVKKNLKRAISLLHKQDFKNARKLFSLVYSDDPQNQDAKAGLLLTSLPENMKNEIASLHELYDAVKTFDKEGSYKVLEEIAEAFEINARANQNLLLPNHLKTDEFGITYGDLKTILQNTKNKRETLQSIFFGTKVLIDNKDEFFEFIDILIENRYYDMALNHIDYASAVFANDKKISQLLLKIKKLENSKK